ncbi:hypothetical protein DL93DRAFT_2103749, partial [Clavulina sp. PMI_390]
RQVLERADPHVARVPRHNDGAKLSARPREVKKVKGIEHLRNLEQNLPAIPRRPPQGFEPSFWDSFETLARFFGGATGAISEAPSLVLLTLGISDSIAAAVDGQCLERKDQFTRPHARTVLGGIEDSFVVAGGGGGGPMSSSEYQVVGRVESASVKSRENYTTSWVFGSIYELGRDRHNKRPTSEAASHTQIVGLNGYKQIEMLSQKTPLRVLS